MRRLFDLLPKMELYADWSAIEHLLGEVECLLLADPAPSWGKFYLFLMQAYARRSGKPRFGDKTPEHVRYLPELAAMFPAARIVHLVRDPRAVCASLRRVAWASHDVVTNAIKWQSDIDAGRRFSQRVFPGCGYLELRYEDLVAHPERTLRTLCEFLGEPFAPEMLTHHEVDASALGLAAWQLGLREPVSASRADSWKQRLNASQIDLIQRIAARGMARHGYTAEAFSTATRLALPVQTVAELVFWGLFSS